MSTARAPALILQNENLSLDIHHKRTAAKGISDSISKAAPKRGGLGNRKALKDISNSSSVRQEIATRKKNPPKEEFNYAQEMFLHDHKRCVDSRKAEMNQHVLGAFFFEQGLLTPDTSPKSKHHKACPESPPRYLERESVPELGMPEVAELPSSPIQWDSPPTSPLRYELPELKLKPYIDI